MGQDGNFSNFITKVLYVLGDRLCQCLSVKLLEVSVPGQTVHLLFSILLSCKCVICFHLVGNSCAGCSASTAECLHLYTPESAQPPQLSKRERERLTTLPATKG